MTEDEREKLEDTLLDAACKLSDACGIGAVHSILEEWRGGEELAELFKNQDDYDELDRLRQWESEVGEQLEPVIKDAIRRLQWGEVDAVAEMLGQLIDWPVEAPTMLMKVRGQRRLVNVLHRAQA